MTEPHATSAHSGSLLDAARIVARGGSLEGKMTALAEHARGATDAIGVSIHLIDAEGTGLIPIGWTPTGDPAVPPPAPMSLETAHGAIASALADRRPITFPLDEAAAARVPSVPPTGGAVAIPLVTADDEGATVVEGLLLWVASQPVEAAPEVALAVADLVAVAIRQARLESALTEHADWLDRVANTDPLTGLANRRTFERMLQLELVRGSRQAAPIGLAIFEVDGLAGLEAEAGAAATDDVLRRVAATLADQLRLIDTVARIAPGTFAAICPGAQGAEAATRVQAAVGALEPSPVGPITVSVGVVRYPDDAKEADELLAAGEAALRAATEQRPDAGT